MDEVQKWPDSALPLPLPLPRESSSERGDESTAGLDEKRQRYETAYLTGLSGARRPFQKRTRCYPLLPAALTASGGPSGDPLSPAFTRLLTASGAGPAHPPGDEVPQGFMRFLRGCGDGIPGDSGGFSAALGGDYAHPRVRFDAVRCGFGGPRGGPCWTVRDPVPLARSGVSAPAP